MAGRGRLISLLVVAVAIAAAGGLAIVWGGNPVASPIPAEVAGGANETSISVYEVRSGATDPSSGSAVIFRSATARPFYLYWAPDGRTVSFLATESHGLSLRIVPAGTGAPLDASGAGTVIRRGEPLYYDWIGA